jgi:hypothetical protein
MSKLNRVIKQQANAQQQITSRSTKKEEGKN